jgi:polyisoprenoid-binding protein YceI
MKTLALAAVAALLALSPLPAAAAPAGPQPGAYRLDLAHGSLNFRINHLGLSHYTARFTRMTAELAFDPDHPQAQTVNAIIDAASLQTNYPDPGQLDFDGQIEREFLEVAKYPQITFRSTKVETTGPRTARVTGDLTLHGVTRPVVLQAVYNGGFPAGSVDPSGARIGFSAKGVIRRSDFGVRYGLPAPGSQVGVGDEIEVAIEAEFTRPASKPPAR